jgi:oligopeptide transport system ATP-binding protein
MTAPLLDIRGLSLSLEAGGTRIPILDGVSLQVRPGEAVGLVGESGAGKSMTARSVIRLLPAAATLHGDIDFTGTSVLAMSGKELRRFRSREVAMIFQDPRAHINAVRPLGDFLTEALTTNFGVSRQEARDRVAGLLATVGIDRADRVFRQYPHQLSGGMLQRVMIAAALAVEPRLLLADEPTTSLDVTTQSELMALLADLRADRDLAQLFITHDLALAAATCDRTVVMYAGRIVEERASASLPETARHPYTAALYASRPSVTGRRERLPSIAGRPRTAAEIDTACGYASRCPYVQPVCRNERPELRLVDGGRSACHFADELASQLTETAGGLHSG